MLAVIDALGRQQRSFEFIGIAPPSGRLADALRQLEIPLIAWSPFDETGERRPAADIERSLVRLINSLQPHLVHGNSLSMSRLLGRIAHGLTVPTTGHLRDIIKLSHAAIEDLNHNQLLVAVSDATRSFHIGQGMHESRISAVHNGVDLDRFQPRPASGWLFRELKVNRPSDRAGPFADTQTIPATESGSSHSPLTDTAKLVACIGQIGLRKGQDVLADAAPLIVGSVPNVHFLIIGERTSGKAESVQFEQNLHERFAAQGLTSQLHLLGNRDDVATILNEIDLLVHPANQEPFGRVLLEASAAGVPIVATNVGGTAEIVVDGLTGLLVPPRDPKSLAAAVVEVLTNEDKSRNLRENARSRAVDRFGIDAAAERLASIWSGVLSKTQY